LAKRPPKTQRKLNPIARAEIGQPRECDECGEVKEVSNKTYAALNKGLRGWSTTCRVCQGIKAAEKAGAYADKRTAGDYTPESIDDTDDKIIDMYFLQETGRDPAKMDELALSLREEVIRLADEGKELESFRLFVRIVKPLIAGWKTPGAIHDDIIDGLLSKHRRRLIIATRYSAKSTLTAIYIAWRVLRDPLLKVMVISRGSKLALRMLRTVRKVFIENCPALWHLKPTEDCLDNAEQFQTPQSLKVTTGGATLSSFGVTSDLPGYRADLTIGDDVEGPKEDTPEKVADLEEVLNELHMINPKGEKVMLGTYQSEFSVYARLADKADSDGESVWELHRACMFEVDPDDNSIRSRWDGMFTDKDGADWRRSVTARAWKLHAMLIADPSILNERPLKISDLLLMKGDPKSTEFFIDASRTSINLTDVPTWGAPKGDGWYQGKGSEPIAEYAMTVAAIDPASGLAGRDAIGVAILGVTRSGMGVIRHLEGVRGPSKASNMRRCAEILREYRATHLVIEETKEGFFGETLENELILLGYPMSVEKVTTGQQMKGRRIIESLAPPMGAGRLVMLEAVAYSDHGGDFVNQLTRISYDGRTGKAKDHDDIVDALSHAVARVKGSLVSDRADNIAEFGMEKLDKWRRVPLRFGGLGGDAGPNSRTAYLGRQDIESGSSMAERLLEEDENLLALEARRDRLQEVVQEDLQMGRQPDQYTVRKIKTLTDQIGHLKSAQVL
jgi:hypothetical protein